MEVGGVMSQAPCVETFVGFLEKATGRLSFEDVERLFAKALEENPVFAEIEKSGALGKNIIIILGGRGCGKTLMIRYIKHRLGRQGGFKYINGAVLVEQVKAQGEKVFQQLIEEQERMLGQSRDSTLTVSIDDVAEAVEIARNFLVKEVELARKYEGRFKLVLATQSERVVAERVMTVELLKAVLPQTPFAEMFFGEEPRRSLLESFRNSYISRRPVTLFRAAALINLDAYWSSLRALNRVKDLAEAIVKLAEFYAKNASSYCREAVDMVAEYKLGLAMLALSSLPKVVRDPEAKAVIEYNRGGDELALNGLGITQLLLEYFRNSEKARLAEEAKKIYNSLGNLQGEVGVDDVEEVLLKACSTINYMTPYRDVSVSSIVPLQPQTGTGKPGTGKRKYGPRVNLIEVRASSGEGKEERRYVAIHCLRTDKKGYVTSKSLKKLEELVQYGIPSEAELRYLVVLTPSKKHVKDLLKALGLFHIGRKGRDVLPLFIDPLTDVEKNFIYLVKTGTLGNGTKISPELQKILNRIVVGTLTLSLRDDAGIPQLAYLMLPYAF
jgi:hypothetical protein